MRWILLIMAIALLTSCSSGNSNNSVDNNTSDAVSIPDNVNIPGDINYSIVKEQEFPIYNKTSIEVRLNKATSEDVLKKIGTEIQRDRKEFSKVYIFYYLPEMIIGNGAWATSHFDPNLKVDIIGGTVEEISKLEAQSVSGEILKKWKDPDPYIGGMKFLVKEDGKLLMKTVFKDGSERKEVLKESKQNGRTRYDYENTAGEYYLILKDGDLELIDDYGSIGKAQVVK